MAELLEKRPFLQLQHKIRHLECGKENTEKTEAFCNNDYMLCTDKTKIELFVNLHHETKYLLEKKG